MAALSWFANYGELSVSTAGGSVTIAAIKGIEISPEFQHVELYGMEKVTRAAVAKHSLKVAVSLKYAMWDPDTDYIMRGVLLGDPARTDAITEDNLNAASYKNKEALFNVTATIYDTSRSRTITIVASDVYFESIPYNMSENEFIVRDLKGTAKYLTIATATVS